MKTPRMLAIFALALCLFVRVQAADPVRVGIYLPLTGDNAFGLPSAC